MKSMQVIEPWELDIVCMLFFNSWLNTYFNYPRNYTKYYTEKKTNLNIDIEFYKYVY